MPFLIDTHAHLHFPPYESDREAVLQRMKQKDIWAITIATTLHNGELGLNWAAVTPGVWATIGLHPEHVTSSYHDPNEGLVAEHDVDKNELRHLASSYVKCVAIGECGLDFYRIDDALTRDEAQLRQENVLQKHLCVARELDLPLVIHCRDALTRLAEILQTEQAQGWQPRGVVHSFTGTWSEAKPLLDLGFHIAVNGIATFPLRKQQRYENSIDRTIENIPLDRLLLETDAPYLAPVPFRGQRNEPVMIEDIAKYVAKTRDSSLANIATQTTVNACHLFQLEAKL